MRELSTFSDQCPKSWQAFRADSAPSSFDIDVFFTRFARDVPAARLQNAARGASRLESYSHDSLLVVTLDQLFAPTACKNVGQSRGK